MIEGTKQFRPRGSENNLTPPIEIAPASPAPIPAPIKALEDIKPAEISPEMAEEVAFEASPEEPANAVNLERRDFFASLVPAFGDGLVKLLRTSNNLKRDLHEAMKEGSEAIAESERKRRSEEQNH
ncbi:MAG: hypothetical protein EOP11_16425 [Proteobacteria bacterium]|nr:MAG: hypothetical protein EOP11_16425 [Pseudomonadota bacterium]